MDAEGSPIALQVHPTDVQDRDGAPAVVLEMLEKAPKVSKLWADEGCQGPKLESKLGELGLGGLLEIVEKPKDIKGFTVLRRRWADERTFAWMSRCRRLSKDYESSLASSLAWCRLAACRFPVRRVARATSH